MLMLVLVLVLALAPVLVLELMLVPVLLVLAQAPVLVLVLVLAPVQRWEMLKHLRRTWKRGQRCCWCVSSTACGHWRTAAVCAGAPGTRHPDPRVPPALA
mgnify:CR=1 FL=1